MKFSFFLLIAVVLSSGLLAQSTPDTTISIKVDGVCDMCKKRIEEAAKGKGVTSATWSSRTKLLNLTIDPAKTNADRVTQRIVSAGHDAGDLKAKEAVYKALPDCCLYRTKATHSDGPGAHDEHDEHDEHEAAEHTEEANNVTGYVTTKTSGKALPLQGASVVWLGTTEGASTDSAGKYTLPSSAANSKVIISYSGFHNDTVLVQPGVALEVMLQPNGQLKGVTVTSVRASMSVNTASAIRSYDITARELTKAACCNLSESFETNPSVDVTFSDALTGSKQIQMLGLAGNYTQLTVENLPGPRGLATSLGLNFIPGTWVDGMQLIKGTGSVVNGFESIAGQINVELKKPDNSEQLYANVYTNDFGKTDLNLNLAKKINSKWSTGLLLHNAFANRKVDMNMDHFRDFPNGNLFSAVNRWSYTNGGGLFAQFGLKYLTDDKVGGMLTFDPKAHKLSTHHYGLEIDIERKEAFAKIGYVYPGKPYKSIGLQLSAFDHKQDSYFGLTVYDAQQLNVYANLIYQSIIGHTGHKFKTGISFQYDKYNELFKQSRFRRTEVVPGAFFEYIFKPSDKFDLIAGIRGDHNNLYGFFATPRINARYEPIKGTTIRISAGRGQRTANIFAENNSVFVSSRSVQVLGGVEGKAYGLQPEVAWNKGISIDQKLRLFDRASMVSVDVFRNDFTNQVVVDLEDARAVRFYNLAGKSYANSLQAEWSFEPLKNLQARLAYRLFDVKTTYGDRLLQKPLTTRHRAFANLAYETGSWKFDYTLSYNGAKRLPSTAANPVEYRLPDYTKSFATMNAQITKSFGTRMPLDLYIGGENLGNFIQPNAILAAEAPFGPNFDASLIWGPISGSMVYAGVRFKIK